MHRMVGRFDFKGKQSIGFVRNFSEIGLFLQTRNLLRLGSTVKIEIGSGETISVEGKVVWRREEAPELDAASPTGMGITLMATSPKYLAFVDKMRKQAIASGRPVEDRFDVYHRVQFETGGAFLTEYTENLSRGGMYLATQEPMAPNSTIRAQLESRGWRSRFKLAGRVAYRLSPEAAEKMGRTSGVGIQFIELSARGEGTTSSLSHATRDPPESTRNDAM